jgi:hypothetical protein
MPFSSIVVDLVGPLPKVKDQDAILTITDRLTKRAMFIPTSTTLTSEGFARILRDHWIKMFGFPATVGSDRGPQFVAAFIKELYKLCGIQGTPSTAYHPQTQGQVEQTHQELETYLRIFVNDRQHDWPEWIPLAEFAFNDHVNASTKQSPHFLTFGFHPSKGQYFTTDSPHAPAAASFSQQMQIVRTKARESLLAAQEAMKHHFDKRKKASWDFKEGQMVWLEAKHFPSTRPSRKLDNLRYGPFKILSKHGPSSFKLDIPSSWSRVFPIFNESLLTPITFPGYPSQKRIPTRPPPEIVGQEPIYEVESILDRKYVRGRPYYLVRWKDYTPADDTWEPLANLAGAPRLITAFDRKHPPPPTRTRGRVASRGG